MLSRPWRAGLATLGFCGEVYAGALAWHQSAEGSILTFAVGGVVLIGVAAVGRLPGSIKVKGTEIEFGTEPLVEQLADGLNPSQMQHVAEVMIQGNAADPEGRTSLPALPEAMQEHASYGARVLEAARRVAETFGAPLDEDVSDWDASMPLRGRTFNIEARLRLDDGTARRIAARIGASTGGDNVVVISRFASREARRALGAAGARAIFIEDQGTLDALVKRLCDTLAFDGPPPSRKGGG